MEATTQLTVKTSELRIGNYVSINGNACAVDLSILSAAVKSEQSDIFFFEPIPLDYETFKKCGFALMKESEYTINTYQYKNVKLWHNNKALILESHNVEIEYLHQLQNLVFALTGEELEVKL